MKIDFATYKTYMGISGTYGTNTGCMSVDGQHRYTLVHSETLIEREVSTNSRLHI